MRNKKIFLIIFFLTLVLPLVISAASHNQNSPQTGFEKICPKGQLAVCVQQIYLLAMGLGALVALLMIVLAGYRYMTAGGNAQAVEGAKEAFASAFIGLIIIFVAFILLYLINPELVRFRNLSFPSGPPSRGGAPTPNFNTQANSLELVRTFSLSNAFVDSSSGALTIGQGQGRVALAPVSNPQAASLLHDELVSYGFDTRALSFAQYQVSDPNSLPGPLVGLLGGARPSEIVTVKGSFFAFDAQDMFNSSLRQDAVFAIAKTHYGIDIANLFNPSPPSGTGSGTTLPPGGGTPPPSPGSRPTASITVNGQKQLSGIRTGASSDPGDALIFKWSGSNGDLASFSSTLARMSAGGGCANHDPRYFGRRFTIDPAGSGSLDLGATAAVWPDSCNTGKTVRVTYTVTNSQTGQSASDTVTINFDSKNANTLPGYQINGYPLYFLTPGSTGIAQSVVTQYQTGTTPPPLTIGSAPAGITAAIQLDPIQPTLITNPSNEQWDLRITVDANVTPDMYLVRISGQQGLRKDAIVSVLSPGSGFCCTPSSLPPLSGGSGGGGCQTVNFCYDPNTFQKVADSSPPNYQCPSGSSFYQDCLFPGETLNNPRTQAGMRRDGYCRVGGPAQGAAWNSCQAQYNSPAFDATKVPLYPNKGSVGTLYRRNTGLIPTEALTCRYPDQQQAFYCGASWSGEYCLPGYNADECWPSAPTPPLW